MKKESEINTKARFSFAGKRVSNKEQNSVFSIVKKMALLALLVCTTGVAKKELAKHTKDKSPQGILANMPETHNSVKTTVVDNEPAKQRTVFDFLDLSRNSEELKSASTEYPETINFSALGINFEGTVRESYENGSGGINTILDIENGEVFISQVGDAVYARINVFDNGKLKSIELTSKDNQPVWEEKEVEAATEDAHFEDCQIPAKNNDSSLKSAQEYSFPEKQQCVREKIVPHYFITQTLVDDLGSIDAVLAKLEGAHAYGIETFNNTDSRLQKLGIEYTYDIVDITDSDSIPSDEYEGAIIDSFSLFHKIIRNISTNPTEIDTLLKELAQSSNTPHQFILCKNLKNRGGAAVRGPLETNSGESYYFTAVCEGNLGYGFTLIHEVGHALFRLNHSDGNVDTTAQATNLTTGATTTGSIRTIMDQTRIQKPVPGSGIAKLFSQPGTVTDTITDNSNEKWERTYSVGDNEHNATDSVKKYFAESITTEVVDAPAIPEVNTPEYEGNRVKISIDNADSSLTYKWSTGQIGAEVVIEPSNENSTVWVEAVNESCNCASTRATVSLNLVGIKENELAATAISIYPNPAHNFIRVKSAAVPLNSIQIYTTNGQLIREINPQGNTQITIRLNKLKPGTYIARFYDEKGNYSTKKIIKE